MRKSLLAPIGLVYLASGVLSLSADTANPGAQASHPQGAHESGLVSFLSPNEQRQYATARAKALADNPQLKAEGDELMKQAQPIFSDGTAADRQAFMEKMNSHRQKLRQAMLKEDSTLEPIFAEIDNHISEMKAKESAPAPSSAAADHPPGAAEPGAH